MTPILLTGVSLLSALVTVAMLVLLRRTLRRAHRLALVVHAEHRRWQEARDRAFLAESWALQRSWVEAGRRVGKEARPS